MDNSLLTNSVKEVIDYVISYVDGNSTDWFEIKKEILARLKPEVRSLFSRRHYSTKKHILNSFDREVITYWESKTNCKIWINPEKLHPENWIQKPIGWGLIKINEERKEKARNRRREIEQEEAKKSY